MRKKVTRQNLNWGIEASTLYGSCMQIETAFMVVCDCHEHAHVTEFQERSSHSNRVAYAVCPGGQTKFLQLCGLSVKQQARIRSMKPSGNTGDKTQETFIELPTREIESCVYRRWVAYVPNHNDGRGKREHSWFIRIVVKPEKRTLKKMKRRYEKMDWKDNPSYHLASSYLISIYFSSICTNTHFPLIHLPTSNPLLFSNSLQIPVCS